MFSFSYHAVGAPSHHITIEHISDKTITLEAAEYDTLGHQFTTLVIIVSLSPIPIANSSRF